MSTIVKYKGSTFLWYANTKLGAAKLITSTGVKYSGTPNTALLKVVPKELVHKSFNGHEYVQTKLGIFSCSTGNKVVHEAILNMFSKGEA